MGERRTLIVEDMAPTREWLRSILARAAPGSRPDVAASLAEARAWLRGEAPDSDCLCLVDLGLPDGSGVDFIRELLARCPAAMPVVTTLFDDDASLLAAMAAGARGYLLKDAEPDDIVRRLTALERGETPISPAMAERILAHFRVHARFVGDGGDAAPALSPRETDVLRMIGRGLTVAETADVLALKDGTVAGYLKTIYRKLDIGTRAEAAVQAVRLGLV